MKKFVLPLVFLMFPVILVGCFDYREINDTAMVSGISIDRKAETGEYTISVEMIQPSGSPDVSSPSAKVLSDHGTNVEDCLERLVNVATKELQFSHCKLILFSEDVAKEGISDLVDYFLRDPEFRADLYLAVVVGTASEMLSMGEKEQRVCAFDYASVIENSYYETGSVPPTKLYQFPMDGSLSLLPAFEKEDETYSVCGSRGFRDGVAYANLDLAVTQSILLASGEYRKGELLLQGNDGPSIACQIRSVKAKKDVEKKEPLSVTLTLECSIYLTSLPGGISLESERGRKEAEAMISQMLSNKLQDDWAWAVRSKADDVFGLGVYVYRHAPQRYVQWEQTENRSPIQFTVECSVSLENSSFSEERVVP